MLSNELVTVSDWRAAYADGASPRQLLGALCRHLQRDSPPEAWIRLARAEPDTYAGADTDALALQIDALDARAARHLSRAEAMRAMPLFGVPFAVKDNIDVAGWPTTAACPAFARTASTSASAVARLTEAGAVCIGKTNLDQFATGLVGARSPYGRPSSTFSAAHVSGGSSSGSAVVVSRGDVPFALGTDTAGSGRVPAGFNNVVGLKPTPGRVSAHGVVPACRSIDCVSVLALSVADAAQVLALIEGADPADAYSAFRLGAARLRPVLRIGVPAQHLLDLNLDPDSGYAPLWQEAVARLGTLGHGVVETDFTPLFAVAELLYGGPWVAERHTVVQTLLAADPGAFDPSVRRVVEAARDWSATDLFAAQHALQDARARLASTWHAFDLLMVPTAPAHPTHAQIDADPIGANARLGTYTNFVNLLGWCALALPAGFTAHGLPFGVTFIAPGAADAALARFGRQWQTSAGLPLGATGRPFASADTDAGTDTDSNADTDRDTDAGATEPAPAWPASAPTLPIAVVGAHLSGLPLNGQLGELGATLREATQTAPHYRLFALPDTTPPKPGLVRVVGSDRSGAEHGGAAIAVEVWDMPMSAVGSFLSSIAPPLGLGSLELADGRWVHGFVCEAHAVAEARDITAFGGWRAYLDAGRSGPPPVQPAQQAQPR